MKNGVFGFGLALVAGALFFACSGTQTTPKPSATADAGPDVSAAGGPDGSSSCAIDADCAQGVCDANKKQCVECRTDAACASGDRCSDGQCINATPCTSGSYSCDGHRLLHCSAKGELEFSRDCAASEYCDERRAQCEPRICKPGVASCDGAKVLVCNEAGSELEPKQLCSLAQTCIAGECKDIACVPNTTFCSEGSVWKCGVDGTTSDLAEHCSSSQFCLEKLGAASCNATACFADDAMCVGDVATKCKPDGSGPKPGGTDCTDSKQVCYAGECRDPLCTPGQKLCDGNSLALCSEAGTATAVVSNCGSTGACDAASGSCKPRICEPGKLGCDSTRVVTCNELGTGWLQTGPDCATSHGICSAGACKPIICEPNQYFCKDDNNYICGADGTTQTLYGNCTASGYHCVANYYYCAAYYCQPNSIGCNGSVLATCKADGSGWVAGGTDCAQSGSVCSVNKCVPKVCTPNTTFCSDGNVQQCDYTGTTSSLNKVCAFGTYCKAPANDNAGCAATPCVPDADGACVAEKFGHCAADGMSITADSSVDCNAAGKVCSVSGCVSSAVDSLAEPSQVGAGGSYYNLYVNTIDVKSARKLTGIEMYLSMPSSRALIWSVYQKVGTSLVLKYQKPTTATGSGYASSGTLNFALEADQTYALGVYIATGSYTYYFDTATSPVVLGFGTATGSTSTQYATSIYYYPYYQNNSLYSQRLTTVAP